LLFLQQSLDEGTQGTVFEMIDVMAHSTTELTADLVAIDSVNPSLVAGGAGEPEIAAYVANWARTAGLLGRPPAIGGASYWADAAFIERANIPTVMFGPAGEGAHAAEEWASIESTEAVASTLVTVAERFCA
jgi:acetylornithine deacetylase/succinyl-diaminopimelate desuccinylase-like protein